MTVETVDLLNFKLGANAFCLGVAGLSPTLYPSVFQYFILLIYRFSFIEFFIVFTSTKEVMCSPPFVCLSVCLLTA